MTQITKEEITNLYLYGQTIPPNDLVDSNLIRPEDAVTRIEVDVPELMQSGAGRFVVGSQFELIQRFFSRLSLGPYDNTFYKFSIPPGTYTKGEVNERIWGEDFYGWTMQQYNFDDGVDDYLDRVWVYNSMAFKISDDARFVVMEDGERYIENLAFEPIVPEDPNDIDNFDFSSDDFTTRFLNARAEPIVDPSGIGRKVFIDYVNADSLLRIEHYSEGHFLDDAEDMIPWYVSKPVALAKLASLSEEFINDLWEDGAIKFLDNNKPIVYGTVDADSINAYLIRYEDDYPTLDEYKDNGVIVLGGQGADTIYGDVTNDTLIGNEGDDTLIDRQYLLNSDPEGNDTLEGGIGNDTLNGGAGNDILDGGIGNDFLDGGNGDKDIAEFSDSFENYDYSISEGFLGGQTITFTHSRGTQSDGTDTLQNLEFARFSDRIVPLPLEDGPEDTRQTDIFDGSGEVVGSASLTLPTFMFDGDAEYTLNLSSSPQDLQDAKYNFAYIVEITDNMAESLHLERAIAAYTHLTNFLISSGIADVSQFSVLGFNEDIHFSSSLSAEEAIATLQSLTPTGNHRLYPNNQLLETVYQDFSGLPEGETNIAYFISDGIIVPRSSATLLQSVADVRAYGFGSHPRLLNRIDSNDAGRLSNPLALTRDFQNDFDSRISLDDLAHIEILLDGNVVDTIQPSELVNSPLGVSFSGSLDNLSVALGAENQVSAQLFFNDGTPSATVDFTVTSGQENIASLNSSGPQFANASPVSANALFAEAIVSDGNTNNQAIESSITTPVASELTPLTKILNGSDGNELIRLGAVDLGAKGEAGNDQLVGNNFDNILDGGAGNDTIFGHDGNDTIVTGEGEDRVDGGDGIDTVVYEDVLRENSLINQVGKVIIVDDTDTLTNVELIQFADTIISTESLQVVPFLQGNDATFVTRDGLNTIAEFSFELLSVAPVDVEFNYTTLDGTALAGSDYFATSGQVTIAAGETTATIEVELLEGVEFDEVFALNISGLSGATFADNEIESTFVAYIDDTIAPPEPEIEHQAGSDGNDTIVGTEENELLDGGGGDDVINAGSGNDTINGGSGFDWLYGEGGDDLINGGADSDVISGGGGADHLHGEDGWDTIYGNVGNDWLYGGVGLDKLYGGGDNDKLFGGTDDDILYGGAGLNSLYGEEGNDTLYAEAGTNFLYGGAGADKFYLESFDAYVNDFSRGQGDKIYLQGNVNDYDLQVSGNNTNLLYQGQQAATLNGTGYVTADFILI